MVDRDKQVRKGNGWPPLDVVRDRQQSECKQAWTEVRSKIDRRPSLMATASASHGVGSKTLSIYQHARLTMRTPPCCAEHAKGTHRAGGLSPECVSMLLRSHHRRTEVRPGHRRQV